MTMTEDNAFYVVKNIDVPSVLCEVGFVTNKTDAEHMLDEAWRQAAAEAIAQGILDYISRVDT
jgi:N-acetylmuramoyl-L-alanine amidase